jgi:hypothetical protein
MHANLFGKLVNVKKTADISEDCCVNETRLCANLAFYSIANNIYVSFAYKVLLGAMASLLGKSLNDPLSQMT